VSHWGDLVWQGTHYLMLVASTSCSGFCLFTWTCLLWRNDRGSVQGVFLCFFSLALYRQRPRVRFSYREKKGDREKKGECQSDWWERTFRRGLGLLVSSPALSWWRETLHREIDLRLWRKDRELGRCEPSRRRPRPFYRQRKEARAEKNLGQETVRGDTGTAHAWLFPRLAEHLNQGGAHHRL
jgi:hypothetical protein